MALDAFSKVVTNADAKAAYDRNSSEAEFSNNDGTAYAVETIPACSFVPSWPIVLFNSR